MRFVAVLFVRAKYRKLCRCPSMEGWLVNWMIYPNPKNSADLKKNEDYFYVLQQVL